MTTTLGILNRRRWEKLGIGMPGDNSAILALARRLRNTVIDGIRVVTLKDLIAIKLISGLKNPGRSKDIADVEDLIRRVPLDKRFAARLPPEIRTDFKKIIEAVRAGDVPRDQRF